jgi:hypothetical protein
MINQYILLNTLFLYIQSLVTIPDSDEPDSESVPAPLLAPTGFQLARGPRPGEELRAGAALVGARVLYRWPLDSEDWAQWAGGRVQVLPGRRAGFSHRDVTLVTVGRYASSSSLGASAGAPVDTLLDASANWDLLRMAFLSRISRIITVT